MPEPLPYASPVVDAFRAPRIPVWATNLLLTALLAALWPLNFALVEHMDPYYLLLVINIGIAVILATSLNLIIGITGQFSLGHAAFMAVGAYTTGILLRHYNVREMADGSLDLSAVPKLAAVLALGGVLASVAALLIGIPTLRLRGDYLAIATLGFGEIIYVVIINTENLGPYYVGGSAGLHAVPIYGRTRFFWTYLCVALCVVAVWRLVYSTKGKAFLAVREDEVAAAAMGVHTTFYKVAAFALGAFFAGVAGGLSATVNGSLDPGSYRFIKSIEIVMMVVLGGAGSVSGVILSAALLTYLPELLRYLPVLFLYLAPLWPLGWIILLVYTAVVIVAGAIAHRRTWHIAVYFAAAGIAYELLRIASDVSNLRMIIYSLALILMMILRPGGLLGRRELWFTRRRLASVEPRMPKANVPGANPPL